MRIKAKKSLGQHFLHNRSVLKKIISAAHLKKTDTILEIGPGTGILTEALAHNVKNILAVEKDKELSEYLENKFSAEGESAYGRKNTNVKIILDDVLKFHPEKLGLKKNGYKVVANIPYYITGKLVRNMLEEWPAPSSIVLMVQKEVAERMAAKPPKMNLLAAATQFYSSVHIVGIVPKSAFRPKPKIDSAIIELNPQENLFSHRKTELFFEVLHAGFRQPRKTLASNLLRYLARKNLNREKISRALNSIGFKNTARPAELSVTQWIKLSEILEREIIE